MSNDIQSVSWPGWETVQLIGRGSFGAVYEIRRQVFNDTECAALKVISLPQNSSDIEDMYNDGYDDESITDTIQSHLQSIVAEYSLMRKLSGSANVVNCEDIRYVQHDDGIGWDIYIKMELLTPLAKALPADVSEETVIKLAKDMCAALMLCKKHSIVHRDIKPQNIFLSENGDYKLGDFGIAKTVEKTMGGTKIGTYKYMAPEVYNNQPYGTGADIYSLGLVLYWLLNERRMPFMPLPPEKLTAGMEEAARSRRLSGEDLPPPAHGSEQLKQIVLKACAFDPQMRYPSAAEMAEALNALSSSAPEPPAKTFDRPAPDPTPARPVSAQPQWQKSTVQSVPVQPIPAAVHAPVQKAVPQPMPKGKKKIAPWIWAIPAGIVLVILVLTGLFLSRNGWEEKDGRTYYYEAGQMYRGWATISDCCYYFGEDGVMQTGLQTISEPRAYFDEADQFAVIKNGTYYFGQDGAMQTGWVTTPQGSYYFNPLHGAAVTGTLELEPGCTYYFEEDGRFLYRQTPDGTFYDLDTDNKEEG